MIKCIFVFLFTLTLLNSNDDVVKTSELELVFFKMAYEGLLKDVKKSKKSSSLNENDLKNINKKIEIIMNELFKDKRVLVKELNIQNDNIDLKKIKEFQKEIDLLKEELFQIKKKKREYQKSLEKTQIVLDNKKEKSITKIKEIIKEKTNFKEIYNSKKFIGLKCFDYEQESISLSISCKEKIESFIKKNKNAFRFELIPVISKDDNIAFTQIQKLLNDTEGATIEKVNRYLKEALSRNRVENALDYVNSITKDLIVTTSNYYVSSESFRGIVFRAYYKQ